VRDEPGPMGVIREYVEGTLEPDAINLSWTFSSRSDIGDRTGARATYSGFFWDAQQQVDGRLGAVEDGEWTVLVDAWAAEGEGEGVESDVHAILVSVEVDE